MENLKIIDIFRAESVPLLAYSCRFSHAMVFKISGESTYCFEGKTISTHPGEMIYIPKGASYTVQRRSDRSEYLLINFDAAMDVMPPQVFSMDGYGEFNYICDKMPALWMFGDQSGRYKCYAAFYNVLAFVLARARSSYAFTTKLDRIAPAVEYLHTHIFDPDLRANDLYALCGMSDTYFRKIFRASFGVSTREYIINKRLDQARSLILSGVCSSIAEVALSVGYTDALYFSRAFSKHFGKCPSDYLR